jgi:hypothetical protein
MLARRCMGRGFTSRYSRSLRFANATLVCGLPSHCTTHLIVSNFRSTRERTFLLRNSTARPALRGSARSTLSLLPSDTNFPAPPHVSARLSPSPPPPRSWSRKCCTGTMRRACSGQCRCQREDVSERARGRADPPAPWARRFSASPIPWGANAYTARFASRPRSCRPARRGGGAKDFHGVTCGY